MSVYPGEIDEFAVANNIPGITYDPADTTNIYAEDINNIRNAIIAIESTLGVNPQSIYDTVEAWLEELQAAVDGGGGGGTWGSITGTLSDQTDLQSALNAKQNALGFTAVANTTTINGYALSANVTLTKSDIGLSNVTNDAQLKASNLDTDGTLAANSDSKIASQKATKTYADTKVPATRQVAGHALSADVTITKSDVGLSSVTNDAQLKASQLDTDGTFFAADNSHVPSTLATKTLVLSSIQGGMQLITSGSFPVANSLSITSIPQTYRGLILVIKGMSFASATRSHKIRLSTNNGSSFIATGYYGGSSDETVSDNTAIAFGAETIAAARSLNGYCTIMGYQNSACVVAESFWQVDDLSSAFGSHGLYATGTSPINAIQVIQNSTGNFDGGTYQLYGIL